MHKLSLVLLALYVGCSQNATLHQANNALTVIALGDAGEDGSTLRSYRTARQ